MEVKRGEVGVEESAKMKLVRSTWAGLVEKCSIKNWQREQMPRKCRRNGGEEDRNCDGNCIESHLERVGEESKELETADRERSKRNVRGKRQW